MCILTSFFMMLTACSSASSSASQQSSQKPSGTSSPNSNTQSASAAASAPETGLQDPNLNPPGVYPICKEPITLKIGAAQNANVSDYVDNDLTRHYQEIGNINCEFELYPSKDAEQKLSVIIASNGQLPDVLMGFDRLDDTTILNYGQSGIIIDLTDYYENLAVHMKEYAPATIVKWDGLKKLVESANGRLYYVPKYNEEGAALYPHRPYINEKWLHKIGWSDSDPSLPWSKEMVTRYPTTTEELYQVLKAFKEMDANGNGKADEMPILGCADLSKDICQWLMNAFVYNDTDYRLIQTDGKLSVAYNTEGWREGLRYMNKLCREELLSPLSFSIDGDQLFSMCGSGDESTVGMVLAGGSSATFRSTVGDDRNNEYRGMAPVEGPDGLRITTYKPPKASPMWLITRDCKTPEAAFMLADAMMTPEEALISRYGFEGVNWGPVENGGLKDGIPVKYTTEGFFKAWGKVQNVHWQFRNPGIMIVEMAGGWQGATNLTSSDDFSYSPSFYEEFLPKEPILGIKYTTEEMEQISEIRANLKTYVNESFARFITGDMDIEKDWDKYIANLESIGLAKYLEVSQAALDRTNGR